MQQEKGKLLSKLSRSQNKLHSHKTTICMVRKLDKKNGVVIVHQNNRRVCKNQKEDSKGRDKLSTVTVLSKLTTRRKIGTLSFKGWKNVPQT